MDTGWWSFVERLMGERRWIPAELARQVGVDSSVVTGWKAGRQPSTDTLRAMSGATGIPLLRLLVESGHLDEAEAEGHAPPLPAPVPPDVLEAIASDPDLLPEAKEHLSRQYGLLLRIKDRGGPSEGDTTISEGPGLRAVARKRGGRPRDQSG